MAQIEGTTKIERTIRQRLGRYTHAFSIPHDPPIPSEVILVISQIISSSVADQIGLRAGDLVTRLGPYTIKSKFQSLGDVAIFITKSNSFTIEVLRALKHFQSPEPIQYVKFEIAVCFAENSKHILGCVLREVFTCHLQQTSIQIESIQSVKTEEEMEKDREKKEQKEQKEQKDTDRCDKSPPQITDVPKQDLIHCFKPIPMYHPLLLDSSFVGYFQNLSMSRDK